MSALQLYRSFPSNGLWITAPKCVWLEFIRSDALNEEGEKEEEKNEETEREKS